MAVVIYTKQDCMFCKKAKTWFNEHNIPFEEKDVSASADFSRMKEEITGATTVPQILIDGHLIGGWDNLSAFEDKILAKLRETYPA